MRTAMQLLLAGSVLAASTEGFERDQSGCGTKGEDGRIEWVFYLPSTLMARPSAQRHIESRSPQTPTQNGLSIAAPTNSEDYAIEGVELTFVHQNTSEAIVQTLLDLTRPSDLLHLRTPLRFYVLTTCPDTAKRVRAELFAHLNAPAQITVHRNLTELRAQVRQSGLTNTEHLAIDMACGPSLAQLETLFTWFQPKIYSFFSANDLSQLQKHATKSRTYS